MRAFATYVYMRREIQTDLRIAYQKEKNHYISVGPRTQDSKGAHTNEIPFISIIRICLSTEEISIGHLVNHSNGFFASLFRNSVRTLENRCINYTWPQTE